MKKPSTSRFTPPKFNAERLRQVRNIIPPVPKRFKRVKSEERIHEAFENIPRITNETVAEHREDVLKGARKYKYPLQHSKHKIVIYSTGLLALAIVAFFIYTGLELYKFQSSSAFIYRVTQVLPLPVARVGSHFVSYENYLFELRRYEHYYQTQQRVDFGGKDGKRQLATYKPVALHEVINAAYVKQLAARNHVRVSSAEVDEEIAALEAQNQSSQKELADVASNFFGWTLGDLKREVSQELLAQKVAATLDTTAQAKANAVLVQLQNGADFNALVAQYSDAADKDNNGGTYTDSAISLASTDVPPAVVRQLQKMQVGQVSDVVQAGDTLEIVKLTGNADGKLQAQHISFKLTGIAFYVGQYQKAHPSHQYISVD
ncbi:MAG TPA: peptidylprolyl isomerase [Candidatus Saccharimonadales bacterium]|nr:peptidylprolyl isomerase [Candidatus Saccharimonadales bacterium]